MQFRHIGKTASVPNQRAKSSLILIALLAAGAASAGSFDGNVVVQWPAGDTSGRRLQLLADFTFIDDRGKQWLAPKGHVANGSSVPPLFRALFGQPFDGPWRRASMVHDYATRSLAEPWREVHRMFYDAAVAAGVSEADARLMYLAIYAQGPRWEVRGSSCYRGCHAAAESLTWKPVASEAELRSVIEWIDASSPALDEIDQRANEAIKRPGPHLFAQGH